MNPGTGSLSRETIWDIRKRNHMRLSRSALRNRNAARRGQGIPGPMEYAGNVSKTVVRKSESHVDVTKLPSVSGVICLNVTLTCVAA